MADLSSAFAGLGIASNAPPALNHHTLNITFPVLSLLHDNTKPYFYPPQNLQFREEPKLGRYHLTPSNLSFWHRFPVKPNWRVDARLSYKSYNGFSGMFNLINNRLKVEAGCSDLEIASFNMGRGEGIWHIFRLTTRAWKSNALEDAAMAKQQVFEFRASSLERCIEENGTEDHLFFPWIAVIADLVYRQSDRACLHVMQQLSANTKHPYRRAEIDRARNWNSSRCQTTAALLASRFKCQLGDGSWVPLTSLDSENLTAYQQEQIPFEFPCGHVKAFAFEVLTQTGDAESADVACPQCGEKVLGEEELAELEVRHERAAQKAFCDADAEFSDEQIPLPATVYGGQNPAIELPPGALQHALQASLASLQVPESVSPQALSLVDLPETQAVLRALQWKAGEDGAKTVYLTPHALWQALLQVSEETLKAIVQSGSGGLPPGLDRFTAMWMTRTVNWLIACQKRRAAGTMGQLNSRMADCQME